MNETRAKRVGYMVRLCVLGVMCGAVLGGCATTYKICLPNAAECSEVKSYRKISDLSVTVDPDGGVQVTMKDVDRQSDGALEQAAADVIRAVSLGGPQ